MRVSSERRVPTGVWFIAGCAASVASVLFVDRTAATLAHGLFHRAFLFVALTHIVDPFVSLAGVGFLCLGGAILSGWRPGPLARALLCGCVAVLVTVAVKDQAKFAFGRLWPETWVNDNPSWIGSGAYGFAPFHGGTGWTAFPSGHMAVITAPMTVAWKSLQGWPGLARWRLLVWVPVALVALGLYGANYHFVGDMIAGTLLGWLCARVTLSFMPAM